MARVVKNNGSDHSRLLSPGQVPAEGLDRGGSEAAPRAVRVETDLLGELTIPDDYYYGIDTARALRNFPITGHRIAEYPQFIKALATVKQAAATVNVRLGLVDSKIADAIIAACRDIREGQFHDQFVVDPIQGGAGTSTNMNANEVIANLALEHLGLPKGRYDVIDPHNHVNRCQSTNDVYPTAAKIALLTMTSQLSRAIEATADAFAAKAHEFAGVLKLGRTQLQDAVPMTLGQEFGSYAVMARADARALDTACSGLHRLNIGGTAIGTGINTPVGYTSAMITELCDLTGFDLRPASDLVEATQDVGAFVQLSGALKHTAVQISKACNDLRLLSSGPRGGLHEIRLPAVQAGSSIMPGKVNPVIPEVVNQVAFEIAGHDMTITMAAESGQLQLNAFEPIIAHSLFEETSHLEQALYVLTRRCITGITAETAHLREQVQNSTSIVTALSPKLGYQEASRIAAKALAENCSIFEILHKEGQLSDADVESALDPEQLLQPIAPQP